MKRLFASVLTLSSLALLAGCGDDKDDTTKPPDNESKTQDVTDSITQDTTFKAGTTYTLKKYIFVEKGTLTIEAGTTILGDTGSALIITREAKLNAVGTAEKPIVFTSAKAAGTRAPGDWGGVVLLGKAKINVAGGENTIEGFFSTSGDLRTKYGGSDDAHDCGKLKYARIEFAGYQLAQDNELNGLTTGACGTATDIDYVQVHRGADDGVEMFGGTAGLKHLVVTQPDDDGLDYDLGYSGKVQFLVLQQNATVGNRGIEASGNKNDNAAAPHSVPEIWNATFIGSDRAAGGAVAQEGLVFNTGAGGRLHNVIVANFADRAVDVDGTASAGLWAATTPELSIQNALFWDNKDNTTSIPDAPNPKKDAAGNVTDPDVSKFVESEKVLAAATGNKVQDPQLTDALNLEAPNFAPKSGSPALNPDNAAAPGAGFDTSARFVGAVGATNWLAGWTAYPKN